MSIKVEINSTVNIPPKTEKMINDILRTVNNAHLHGIDRITIVDEIFDPRYKNAQKTSLPGIYHPKQMSHGAWLELAIVPLLSPHHPFYKKILPRLSFKGNVAAVLFSLIGQHYYLTLRHSVKKSQLEASVRVYTEKQLRIWGEKNQGLRSRIFKPFQPIMERWAKSLQKRAKSTKNI